MRNIKFLGFWILTFLLSLSVAFSYDNFMYDLDEDNLNVTLIGDGLIDPIFYYKEDYKLVDKNCSFVETSSGVWNCNFNLDRTYESELSTALKYNIEIDGVKVFKNYFLMPIKLVNDNFSKNLFLNLSNNVSSQVSNKCSVLANDSDCKYMYDWAYMVKNLVDLYNIDTDNQSYYLTKINESFSMNLLGSCDFRSNDFVCDNSNPISDNFNVSGSFKQAILADAFLELYSTFGNQSYYDYALSYIKSSNFDCDIFTGDLSCENNLISHQGNNFGQTISSLVKFYVLTGNNTFLSLAENLSSYVVVNNYENSALILNSFVDLYLVNGDESLINLVLDKSKFLDSICISSNCNVVDLKYSGELYKKLSYVTNDFYLKSFFSQNSVYKLFLENGVSCSFLTEDYSCDFSYEQYLILDLLGDFTSFHKNLDMPYFYFPHSKNSLNVIDTNFTYGSYVRGFVKNVSLNFKEYNVSYSELPINRSNYFFETLNFIDQFAHKGQFNFDLVNGSRLKFPSGNLTIVVTENESLDRQSFKDVSNLSVSSSRYFCDPEGKYVWDDFSCYYDNFQGSVLSMFFSSESLGNNLFSSVYNLFDEVEKTNESRFSSCDFKNLDFDCENEVSTYNPSLQIFKQSGSNRQSSMIGGFYDSIIYESRVDNFSNNSLNYFVEYSYGKAEDCDVFSADYSCFDNISQAKRLNSLFYSYKLLGDEKFFDKAKQIISYSLANSNYGVDSEFLTAVWNFADYTGDYSIFTSRVNLESFTNLNSNNCFGTNCSVFEKSNEVNLLLSALKASNDVSYQAVIDEQLFARTTNFDCDSFAYFSLIRYSNVTPSDSILDCDFIDQTSSGSKVFSNLYSDYYSPVQKFFEVNISSSFPSNLNYGDNFNVSCSVKNYQNSTLNNVLVNVFSPFGVVNGSSPSGKVTKTTASSFKITSIDTNETINFNFALNADVGGLQPVSCIAGKNSSSINFVSDNIGLIGNLSAESIKSISVSKFNDEFFMVNFSSVPFMLENLDFKFTGNNFVVTGVNVYDSFDENLRSLVSSSFVSATQTLSLGSDVLKGQERYLFVSGYSNTFGNADIKVDLTTGYNGFNNATSNATAFISNEEFDVVIPTIPTTLDSSNILNVTFVINNSALYNGVNFSLDNFKVKVIPSDSVISSLNVVSGIYYLKTSDTVGFNKIDYQDSVVINFVLDATSFPGRNANFILEFTSDNGFFKNVTRSFTTYSESGSGGNSGGSNTGGGGSGGGSSGGGSSGGSSGAIDNSAQEIFDDDKTSSSKGGSGSGDDGDEGGKGSTYSNCDTSLVKNFSVAEINESFNIDREFVYEFLEQKRKNYYSNYLGIGNEFLNNGSGSRLKIDEYFKQAYGDLGFNLDEFYKNSYDLMTNNLQCYSLSVYYGEYRINYDGLSSCGNVDDALLLVKADSNVDLTFDKKDYYVDYFNHFVYLESDTSSSFNAERNAFSKACLYDDNFLGLVVYNEEFIKSFFEKVLVDAVNLLNDDLKIELNIEDFMNSRNIGVGVAEFSDDSKNLTYGFSLLNDISDKFNFSNILVWFGLLFLFLILLAIFSKFYYGIRKLKENLFFNLNYLEKHIDNKILLRKELIRFYDRFGKYFEKRTFYSLFIDFEKYEQDYRRLVLLLHDDK